MRLSLVVLVALFSIINAAPMHMNPQFLVPPPANINFMMRPTQHLMPGAGMRMLSSTYKPASHTSAPSAPVYGAAPHYGHYGYPPHAYGNLNIANNNDNLNQNLEQMGGHSYDGNYNANAQQNQDLTDILTAYSLQNFLQQSARSAPSHYSAPSREYTKKYSKDSYAHKSSSYGHKDTHKEAHKDSHKDSYAHKKTTHKESHKESHKDYLPTPKKTDYTPKHHEGY